MQYLSDIGDNSVYTYGAFMYTSVRMTDPAIAAATPLLLLLYLLPLPHYLKKRLDTCNNSKDGG
jgi:hypothetical protein